MGTMFGAFLAKAGEEVCMIDVRKDHIDAINEKGLIVKTPDGDETVAMKGAYDSAGAAEVFGSTADAILIFTKTPMNKMVLDQAGPLIGENTYLVTTQNGYGSEEQLAEYVARDHVIFGTTALSATLGEPGTINYKEMPMWNIHMMPLEGGMNAVCEQIADSLTKGGLPAFADMDTEKAQWKKIVTNCVGNSASALTRLKSDKIFSHEFGMDYAKLIADEVIAVANAKGIDITYEDVKANLEFSANLPVYPSMGLDAINHRITEIGTLNGAIVKLGKQYGIPTPANAIMYYLVSILQDNYDGLPESQN